MTMADLIDLGGTLNKEIKSKTKDLDKIKVALRKTMGASKMDEGFGEDFRATATDYTAVTVDKEAAIKSFIGVTTAQIDKDVTITLSGADLIQLLVAANFSIAELKKVFTEDGMNALTTSVTKHFYTMSFFKNEE